MLPCGRLHYFWSRRFANAKSRRNLLRFRCPQELLEVSIFCEDIGESLFDNIISASADKGSVLIDLSGGCIR